VVWQFACFHRRFSPFWSLVPMLVFIDFCTSTLLTFFCTFWDIPDIFASCTSPVIGEGSLPFCQWEDLHLPCQPKDTAPYRGRRAFLAPGFLVATGFS
jgi:hypothetical protein